MSTKDTKSSQDQNEHMQSALHPIGNLVIQIVAMPKDTNANGDIFGGWLVSNMDMGSAIEARRIANSRVVTVAINELVFIKPVNVGDTISCYANLIKIGRTSIQMKIETWANPLSLLPQIKVAEGIFTFVAIDDQGKPQPVHR